MYVPYVLAVASVAAVATLVPPSFLASPSTVLSTDDAVALAREVRGCAGKGGSLGGKGDGSWW